MKQMNYQAGQGRSYIQIFFILLRTLRGDRKSLCVNCHKFDPRVMLLFLHVSFKSHKMQSVLRVTARPVKISHHRVVMTRLLLERRSLVIDGEICKEIFTAMALIIYLLSARCSALEWECFCANIQIARC